MNPPVWIGSALVVLAFVTLGALFPGRMETTFAALQGAIVDHLGWFFALATTAMLAVALYLLVGPHGDIKLGPPDAEPEFRFVTWMGMLIAAGMGIGIVFFGVAEPLSHLQRPLFAQPGSDAAVRESMRLTFFHWGLHPWAIYTCIALPLAYFHFRHGLPLAPRSLLYPLLGDRIHGWIGHGVDILCTVGTLFGVATSLGLGAVQINAGLESLFGWPKTTWAQLAIIAVVTAVATVSVVTGVKGGIRALSTFNLGLATAVVVFVLIAGPTVYVLDLFVTSLGDYLQHLPQLSLYVEPGESGGWQADWTLFYWSWWISWSPFVGVFVARVSRGRTVREFVAGALLVPSLSGFLWFSIVGGTGLWLDRGGTSAVGNAATDGTSGTSLFVVLEQLPWSSVTTVATLVLIFVFFVTSSDSGSLVDDMVTSGGDPNPPVPQRIFWAIAEGAIAAVLLLGGGLVALRSVSLSTGLPMAVFLLIAAYGLLRALGRDELRPGSSTGTGSPATGP